MSSAVQKKHVRVRLHPFIHQVSGTNLMLLFDEETICKPLTAREFTFYKVLPDALREYTAKYKGKIAIVCEETSDGVIDIYGLVNENKLKSLQKGVARNQHNNSLSDDSIQCLNLLHTEDSHNDGGARLRVKRTGSIDMDEGFSCMFEDPSTKLTTGTRLSKHLTALLQSQPNVSNKFIMLENLVSKYQQPSILDLKMGTRTHSEDDKPSKSMEKQRKAAISTTSSHGVRLSGMQKYDAKAGKYLTLDKKHGVALSGVQFEDALRDFLFDGTRFRKELLPVIINRLRKFYHCISSQLSFRFYSSSLLIIYDGAQSSDVDVRCIDFEHTSCKTSAENCEDFGPDQGYLFGVQCLTKLFESMLDS